MSEETTEYPEQTQEGESVDPVAELESLQIEGDDFAPDAGTVAEPEEKKEVPTDKMLLLAISPLFDIFAPAWEVSADEKEALAGAYAEVIDKYFPEFDAGCELNAIIITGMIVAPRIGKPRKIEPESEQGEAVNDGD
jgi:hypothetical protein